MLGQQVFRPFTFATGDDAQRYLSLVSDFTRSIKAVRTKLVGQAERGTDPWDRYGACLHQRFVAQRLVVDTGINLLGWTEAKAHDYMASMAMESPAQVTSEILRYGTDLPAQALSYRLGSEKFWQLRRTAERALGGRFDVREFHEVVLGHGTLPLTAVECNVDAYASG